MRINRASFALPALLVVLTLAPLACGGGAEPPVAVPSAAVSRERAPLGSPLVMTYRFQVAPDATFDREYRVMVHFVDADREMMWTDDHNPPTPTAQWKPGQTIEYTRTIFIPVYPYLGKATIAMGLYDPKTQQRLPLSGVDDGQRGYEVASLELLPQSEGIFLVNGTGWHDQEVAQDNTMEEWRWTNRDAQLSFRNPQRDLTFYLDADSRTDVFESPQQVSLVVGGQVIETFPIRDSARFLHKTSIPASALGTAEIVEMQISVDKTFVPAQHGGGVDNRDLGIRVFHVFVEAK
jgi:hypothetical protein